MHPSRPEQCIGRRQPAPALVEDVQGLGLDPEKGLRADIDVRRLLGGEWREEVGITRQHRVGPGAVAGEEVGGGWLHHAEKLRGSGAPVCNATMVVGRRAGAIVWFGGGPAPWGRQLNHGERRNSSCITRHDSAAELRNASAMMVLDGLLMALGPRIALDSYWRTISVILR